MNRWGFETTSRDEQENHMDTLLRSFIQVEFAMARETRPDFTAPNSLERGLPAVKVDAPTQLNQPR